MVNIPNELIQEHLRMPPQLFDTTSDGLFIGIADNGNHFLKKGIREGTKLVFDRKKPYNKGQLSCFLDADNKLHLLTRERKGYTYLGGLIATISPM